MTKGSAAQSGGVRPQYRHDPGIQHERKVYDRALHGLPKLEDRSQSRQVLLFRGDMIDAPDHHEPRFPADKATMAAHQSTDT